MKGIILAGGTGSRLRPLTEVVCKQLLPVYDKPMIYYPLSTLIHAGVDEILVITSPSDLDKFKSLLGNGNRFGIKIEYEAQPKPDGLPQGILIAEDFINGEDFWFILGDNLFHGPEFGSNLKEMRNQKKMGATTFSYRVSDVSQYGTVRYSPVTGKAVELIEKPDQHEVGWAIPGFYYFDSTAVTKAKELKPSRRGELEIIDLLASYLHEETLEVQQISRGNAWFDLGTAENLLIGSQFVHLIQTRQGMLVGSPEEASLNAGNLTNRDLIEILENAPDSSYFFSLRSNYKEKAKH